jgi:hypothetical protein
MLGRHGLELFDVEHIPTKGGSIRGFVRHRGKAGLPVSAVIGEMIETERIRGFDRLELYQAYSALIEKKMSSLTEWLDTELTKGALVAGYGASTTTTTLMWQADLTRRLAFVLDDNPKKHGLYCPACHIPVLPSDELYIRMPDVVVVLAWQYAKQIIRRHAKYLEEGGLFIIPLPELTVVDKHLF